VVVDGSFITIDQSHINPLLAVEPVIDPNVVDPATVSDEPGDDCGEAEKDREQEADGRRN